MTDKGHFLELDGVRGLAAGIVLFSHASARQIVLPDSFGFLGFLGVATFFSLSGFLMAYLYLSKEYTVSSVFKYGVSRFSRIAPAYLLVIVISFFIYQYLDPAFVYKIRPDNLLRHLLFSGNVSVFWSIPPEVQFYAFFLLLWWSVSRLFNGSYLPFLAVLTILMIMVLVSKQVPGTTLPSKIGFFILGAFAGYVRTKTNFSAHLRTLASLQIVSFIGLFAFSYWLFLQVGGKDAYFSWALVVLAALFVFLASFSTPLSRVLLANPVMRSLGKWSFSLYLLHEIILQRLDRLVDAAQLNEYLALLLGVVISIAVAAACYQFWERPAQHLIKTIIERNNVFARQYA